MKNDFSTVHYLIALLKAYGVKNIVSSPGIQNAVFNAIVQDDEYFNCYSVIDERSAGYVAIGLINETEKPAIITCTGATAARNYMSSMTEAFYRNCPLIAITFYDTNLSKYSLSPQYTDRTVSQNDIKYLSVHLKPISSPEDLTYNLMAINDALFRAVYKMQVVHINCPACFDWDGIKNIVSMGLPENVWSINYYRDNFSELKSELINKKIAIFIGSHSKFTQNETEAISEFATSWNIPVFCDHTSHYYGKNKILITQAFTVKRNLNQSADLVIDIGSIGEYASAALLKNAQIWRISTDGELKARNNRPVTKIFNCSEEYFFKTLKNTNNNIGKYYNEIIASIEDIKTPELPLCNAFICENLAKYLPENSSLHCSILNSLRNINMFKLKDSINVYCNVGGFGIDGAVSTLVGQALANSDKKVFGLIGDLAFFYDMNILGNRHIKSNLRILLVNNVGGTEFRLNPVLEVALESKTDNLIAAAGHNKGGAKGWAESCGFHYMTANTKETFSSQIDAFCNENFDKPVLFEVFTTTENEQKGLDLMRSYNRNHLEEGVINAYKIIKKGLK